MTHDFENGNLTGFWKQMSSVTQIKDVGRIVKCIKIGESVFNEPQRA